MDNIEFLSREEYINYVKDLDDGHWTKNTIIQRWDYHHRAVEVIKSIKINDAKKVLEMGTMGMCCVKGSDTIDFSESWDFKGKNPTFNHDAREFPWPIEDKKYEVFVALRVYQHLVPVQAEAIKEAFRVAKKVIIVTPDYYDNPVIPNSKGIKYSDFVSVLDGVHPNVFLPTAFGGLYYWDSETPSYFDLSSVMKEIKLFELENKLIQSVASKKPKNFFRKVLNKINK